MYETEKKYAINKVLQKKCTLDSETKQIGGVGYFRDAVERDWKLINKH